MREPVVRTNTASRLADAEYLLKTSTLMDYLIYLMRHSHVYLSEIAMKYRVDDYHLINQSINTYRPNDGVNRWPKSNISGFTNRLA